MRACATVLAASGSVGEGGLEGAGSCASAAQGASAAPSARLGVLHAEGLLHAEEAASSRAKEAGWRRALAERTRASSGGVAVARAGSAAVVEAWAGVEQPEVASRAVLCGSACKVAVRARPSGEGLPAVADTRGVQPGIVRRLDVASARGAGRGEREGEEEEEGAGR